MDLQNNASFSMPSLAYIAKEGVEKLFNRVLLYSILSSFSALER